MATTYKGKNRLASIAVFFRALFPNRLQMQQDKAMRELMNRNDSHLLDDIGIAAPNDNERRGDSDEKRMRRPWLL